MKIVTTSLLFGCSMMAAAQTMNSVKFVKLVANPAKPDKPSVFVVAEVRNDQKKPITLSNGQFVLVDAQGKRLKASSDLFPGNNGGPTIPVPSAWSELPQQMNPGITIKTVLRFAVPQQLKVADLSLCMRQVCLALGPVEAALASAPPVDTSDTTSPTSVYQISSDITPPRLIRVVDPVFPPGLPRRSGWGAMVVVGLIVDELGNPQQVHVVRPFGSGLDENAVEAVKRYRFKPASLKGKPVPVEVNIEVNFKVP